MNALKKHISSLKSRVHELKLERERLVANNDSMFRALEQIPKQLPSPQKRTIRQRIGTWLMGEKKEI